MTVRKLRAKQRGPRCSHCDARAVHRGVNFTRFACDEHLAVLQAEDDRQAAVEREQIGDGF